MTRDRGFALLAVLWVVVALSALTAGAVGRARTDRAAAGSGIASMRARWAAEGCLAAAQARIETDLARRLPFALPTPDTLFFPNGARCTVTGYDPGTRLLADSLTPDMRNRLDAALAPLADGGRWARDTLMTEYGDGRLNLNAAPRGLLGTLPGVGAEAIRVIEAGRAWRRPLTGLDDLAQRLSPAGRAELYSHYPELAALASFQATSIVVRAVAWTTGGDGTAAIEVHVVDGGIRAAIVRRRML